MKAISTFGRAMAQVMKSRMAFHDVTQGDMAAAMGISQSQLSKILRAERTIDLEAFEAFCEALEESPSILVKEAESLTHKQRERPSSSFIHAAKLIYVENGERLASPKPALADATTQPDGEDIDLDAWANRIKAEDSISTNKTSRKKYKACPLHDSGPIREGGRSWVSEFARASASAKGSA